ncbi:unnamed protein product [Xylocopa violacea]|uniref:ABC transporter domain-containing protein n=2 Tax=Xylocopa violacea TaxID=135666 RepID=A0ABP1NH50_XYLVO
MMDKIRIFCLLLYKNLMVRGRHWKMTIFVQCLMPIALFTLIQAVRDYSVKPPRVINESSYYPIETKEELTVINREFLLLYYVPQNSYTESIIEDVRMCLNLPHNKVTGFATEDDMINSYIALQTEVSDTQVLALVFEQYNTTDIRYKIRHAFKIPTILFQNMFDGPGYNAHTVYLNVMPFLPLQMCVDETFINRAAPHPIMDTKVSLQRMPYPPFVMVDESDTILRLVICMFAVIVFLIPLCVETNYATKEKYIGVNVLMAMNGVKHYQNLLSWLITGTAFSILYIIPMIILFKNTFSGNVDPYLYYSNTFIFWLILTTHVAHLISFGMHVAAYFSNPRFVITTLSIIYTASFSLHGHLIKEDAFSIIPFLGIFFPNILLYRFLEEVNAYETQLTGMQWSNMFVTGEAQYDITGSIGFIFLFSLLGTLLHFSLAVYINAILPGKYGVREDPLYFLKNLKKNKICLDEDIEDFDYDNIDNENFEPVTKGVLTPGIQIRNLKKTYKSLCLRKTAVEALKGISMDLYKGQITALLGHNGAGKTTLMSILTGVISATTGKVLINGKNIVENLQSIRNDLGLCPQENMVFPDLSVFEQLEFFGLLKGVNKNRKKIQQDVNVLLDKLKLQEKRNVLPSKLSGGQKRRLCLGMALIGDASIIILDEPTSGMDPETRRDIWDIILKIRGKKTILISTHNMEEADILGDRVAIVHGGQLKCYGTSMFLKKQYGYGHIEVTLSTKSWCNADKVINMFDPRTQQVSVDNEKIVLSVPNTETLPQCLDKVEEQKETLGVTGISVSLITLEEVFLKVINREDSGKHLNELFCPPSQKVEGWSLCIQAILALYHKKLTYTKKNLGNLLQILLLPLLSVVLMGLSYNTPSDSTNVFPLELNMYRYPKSVYSCTNRTIGIEYKNSVKHFGGFVKEIEQNTSVTNVLLDHAIQDIAEYLIIVLGFYLLDVILDIRLYYKIEILTMMLLLLLFGMSSLFITYIFSFVNKLKSNAQTILSIVPVGLVLFQYLLHEVTHSFDYLKVLYSIQKRLLVFIPHVSLFRGQLSFFNVAIQNARCRRLSNQLLNVVCLGNKDVCCGLECMDGVCKNQLPYFSNFDGDLSLGECVLYLCLTPFIYFAILIILEERIPQKLKAKILNQNLKNACDIKDDQVKKEKHIVALEIRRLQNRGTAKKIVEESTKTVPTIENDFLESPGSNNDNLFLVYELSKYYGKLMAVQEISFRVKQRECFGLLGVNGAGKSTTFRMLTGEEMPDSGTMYLGKSEIYTDRKNYLSQMGYCPQTDALLTSLNSFDHLRLFAILRGIPKSKVDLEVNKWINRLNLNACMHQPSGTYSGGNKRRLNIAMALIGNPTLVLLDEPTTGVDPAARRSLWNILQTCQAMGQAIILTSHSMEECEALCNRLVIMVKGQLVCIGASQELKQRFGAGYDIHVKLNPSRTDDDVYNIKRIIESSLPCEIRDENLGLIAYHVSDIGTTWEKMYSTMNDLKRQYSCIEDYAVLSATLEQLFIQFARGSESTKLEASTIDSTTQTVDV